MASFQQQEEEDYFGFVDEAKQNLNELHQKHLHSWGELSPAFYAQGVEDQHSEPNMQQPPRQAATIDFESYEEEEEEEVPDDVNALKDMVRDLKETNERIMGQNLALLKDVQDMQTSITELRAEKAVMADKLYAGDGK